MLSLHSSLSLEGRKRTKGGRVKATEKSCLGLKRPTSPSLFDGGRCWCCDWLGVGREDINGNSTLPGARSLFYFMCSPGANPVGSALKMHQYSDHVPVPSLPTPTTSLTGPLQQPSSCSPCFHPCTALRHDITSTAQNPAEPPLLALAPPTSPFSFGPHLQP